MSRQGPHRGPLITFEGGEGTGKSLQVARLCATLEARGVPCLATREPGATPLGQVIEGLIRGREGMPLEPVAELLLFLADRHQHVSQVVAPALRQGRVVVCDRFLDSSEVYQGRVRGLGWERVRRLNQWVCGDVWPDLTILLDLEPEVGLARAARRQAGQGQGRDRLEREELDFHRRVRQGYLDQARAEPERIRVIPAAGSPQEVAARVWQVVEPFLEEWPCGSKA